MTPQPPASVNPIPEPKIYKGLPFIEYVRWQAINFHSLLPYKFSPMHARHQAIFGQKETPSLRLGDAAHAAVLQPEVFAGQYVQAPEFGDLRTKAAKEKRDAFEAETRGSNKIVVPNGEYADAVAIRRAIENHPIASAILLTSPGANEVSFAWDQATPLGPRRCKGRIDRLCQFEGGWVIADLKTAREPWHRKFAKAAAEYEYHSQLGTYREGLGILAKIKPRAAIVAIQNEPPHEIAVYWINEGDLSRGVRRFRSWLATHVECERAKHWPAAIDQTELNLPKWADADESAMD